MTSVPRQWDDACTPMQTAWPQLAATALGLSCSQRDLPYTEFTYASLGCHSLLGDLEKLDVKGYDPLLYSSRLSRRGSVLDSGNTEIMQLAPP